MVTDVAKEWLPVVGVVVTAVAVVVGGVIARRNSQIFRAKAPHVIVSHEISHRQVGTRYVHIFVTAVLHNSSRVHIEFLDGFATIQQVRPVSDGDIERLYEQVFVEREQYGFQWAYLDWIRNRWGKDQLHVEPGEIETETFDFVVQRNVESVAVTTYFYNSRVVGNLSDHADLSGAQRRGRLLGRWLLAKGPLGWGRTTVYDMVATGKSGECAGGE